MPRFDVDSITIDPDDFVSKCTDHEIEELLNEIRRTSSEIYDDFIDGDINERIQEQENGMDNPRSESHRVFNNNLIALKMGYYSVSKEDADIIAIIAKKYGAL